DGALICSAPPSNWRAGCGKPARPVRREGRSKSMLRPYPYQVRSLNDDRLERFGFPQGLFGHGGEFVEGVDFGFGEEEASGGSGFLSPLSLELAGEHGTFVA